MIEHELRFHPGDYVKHLNPEQEYKHFQALQCVDCKVIDRNTSAKYCRFCGKGLQHYSW